MKEQVVGSTRTFILTKGFVEVSGHAALLGEDQRVGYLLSCMLIQIDPK